MENTLYKIIGLNVSVVKGHSYETKPNSKMILHDESEKGISKEHQFTIYKLYIEFGNTYYVIQLSEIHIASLGGALCSIGHLNVELVNQDEMMTNITHVPSRELKIDFELNESYEDDLEIYASDEPDKPLLKFSYDGNDERRPSGFVFLNMDLFIPK